MTKTNKEAYKQINMRPNITLDFNNLKLIKQFNIPEKFRIH